jgi:ankyrin repeat protein
MNIKFTLVLCLLVASTKSVLGMEEPSAKRHCTKAEQKHLNEALHEAIVIANLDKVRELIEQGADVNSTHIIYGGNSLHTAVFSDKPSEEMLKLLIDFKADVNALDEDEETLLEFTLRCGEIGSDITSTLELFLNNGFLINSFDGKMAKLLKAAVFAINHKALEFFLQPRLRGAVSSVGDKDRLTLFNVLLDSMGTLDEEDPSVMREVKTTARILIRYGKLWKKEDEEDVIKLLNDQPLLLAVIQGDVEAVKTLINHGVEPSDRKEALFCALAMGRKDIVVYLVGLNEESAFEALAAVKSILLQCNLSQEEQTIYEAIRDQLVYRIPLVDQIMERPQVHTRLVNGISMMPKELAEKFIKLNPTAVLKSAVTEGNADLASLALQASADPGAVDKEGISVLGCAALHKNIQEGEKIVELLLQYGAQPTIALLNKISLLRDSELRVGIIQKLIHNGKAKGIFSDVVLADYDELVWTSGIIE